MIRVEYQNGEVTVWSDNAQIAAFDVQEDNDADSIVRMFERLGYEVTAHVVADMDESDMMDSLDWETCPHCGELPEDCDCNEEDDD